MAGSESKTKRAMERRAWLLGLLCLLAAPVRAQVKSPARVFRIGLLGGSSRTSPESSHIWGGLFEGMRALGYIEGQNIVVEERWYGDTIERLPALAEDLVKLRVDVIVVGTQPAPEAAKRATSTIPIVMINHGDPVGSGLVSSLAKPGGNVTGMSLNALALLPSSCSCSRRPCPDSPVLQSCRIRVSPFASSKCASWKARLGP